MKFTIAALALPCLALPCLALTATALAFADSCPMQMKAIDAKLSSNPKQSAAAIGKVKTLRADGKAFHKGMKHVESEKGFRRRQEIAGRLARFRNSLARQPGTARLTPTWQKNDRIY